MGMEICRCHHENGTGPDILKGYQEMIYLYPRVSWL